MPKNEDCDNKLSKRLRVAETAVRFVKRTCVYGADNRPEDMEKTNGYVATLMKESRATSLGYGLIEYARQAIKYCAGRCEEQTSLAIIYLLSCGVRQVYKLSTDAHTFFGIGLDCHTDLTKKETIPEDAVIGDPWENEVYPAREFEYRCLRSSLTCKVTIQYSSEQDELSSFNNRSRESLANDLKEFLTNEMFFKEKIPKDRPVFPVLGEISEYKKLDSQSLKQKVDFVSVAYKNKVSSDKKKYTGKYQREKKLKEWTRNLFINYLNETEQSSSCPIDNFNGINMDAIISDITQPVFHERKIAMEIILKSKAFIEAENKCTKSLYALTK